jgi:CDP-diacylglycerol--serine O-phosphatidyltransferase
MKKYFPVLEFLNIPNLITTLGLAFGITACYFITQRDLKWVMVCMFFASSMDLLDGFFANKLNQETHFGQYLDSLVDFFICCLLPMFLVYTFIGADPLIFIGLIFYCACGLWRLAYFDVLLAEKRTYFTGMPVPGGMGFVMMAAWLTIRFGMPYWVCMIVFIAAGFLMIGCLKLEKYGIWQKVMGVGGLIFIILVIYFN